MIKKFEEYCSDINTANEVINEGIFNFLSKSDNEVKNAVDNLKKKEADIISKYDLPESDIENIKTRISDAISKKVEINPEQVSPKVEL